MTKTDLHRLIAELPEESWEAAAVLLRRAQDPTVAKLDAAPYDDEELTDEVCGPFVTQSEPGVEWSEAQAELNAG